MTGMTLHSATPVPNQMRTIARARGVRQADLASAIGVTRQGIVRRLQGETRFTDRELATLAELLEVPVGAFFAEVPALINATSSPSDVDAAAPASPAAAAPSGAPDTGAPDLRQDGAA